MDFTSTKVASSRGLEQAAGWSRRSGDPVLNSGRSWYVLILLMSAYALSFIDRQLLNLLVEPVKRSLLLTDTQISFLQGAAFVSAYCLAAPIFGRLVDVANRRNVLIVGIMGWSVCTMFCSLADTFWQLALARFGVGFFEASVFPVAWSMIPQLFSAERTTRAYGTFMLGSQLGSSFSLLAGGFIFAIAGGAIVLLPAGSSFEIWQASFIVVGLPGLILAMVLFTFRDPHRRSGRQGVADEKFSLQRSLQVVVARKRFYGCILVSNGLMGTVNLCLPAWFPAFLGRVYHAPLDRIGLLFGGTLLVSSTLGLISGPVFARWLERRGYDDALLRVSAMAGVGMLLFSLMLPLSSTIFGALLTVSIVIFFSTVCIPLVGSACQLATPRQMRGLVSSMYALSVQIVSYGLGPTLVALCTDKLFKDQLMVGYSLQIVCSTASAIMIGSLLLACSHYKQIIAEPVE